MSTVIGTFSNSKCNSTKHLPKSSLCGDPFLVAATKLVSLSFYILISYFLSPVNNLSQNSKTHSKECWHLFFLASVKIMQNTFFRFIFPKYYKWWWTLEKPEFNVWANSSTISILFLLSLEKSRSLLNSVEWPLYDTSL